MTGGDKSVSERRARELFPVCFPAKMLKKDASSIADALVIARYGWEREAL
jgi:hypothetical protein